MTLGKRIRDGGSLPEHELDTGVLRVAGSDSGHRALCQLTIDEVHNLQRLLLALRNLQRPLAQLINGQQLRQFVGSISSFTRSCP